MAITWMCHPEILFPNWPTLVFFEPKSQSHRVPAAAPSMR